MTTQRLTSNARLAQQVLDGNASRIDVLEWLVQPIREGNPSLSPAQAEERAERRLGVVCEAIDAAIEAQRRVGLTPPYEWETGKSSGRLIHVGIVEDQAYSDAAEIVALRSAIRAGISTDNFTFRHFEALCVHLLDIYGTDPTLRVLTPPTSDDGFDFYALYRASTGKGPTRLSGQSFRIAGQAKQWMHDVPADIMEGFGGKLRRWRLGAGRHWLSLPTWFRESPHPILGLFVTTADFQSGAREAATENVILCLNGALVAEDLAASPQREEWFDAPDGEFDVNRFCSFFEEN